MEKKIKVFIGGILMEVNSFNPVLATKETFRTWLEGSELESMRGTSLELGGVYARLDQEADVEIVPGFFAQACTSGPLDDRDFQEMAAQLFESLRAAGAVDGVLLVMHGALQSTAVDDCEGFLLEGVREIVGEDLPVCTSLDFHAMFTEKMVRLLTSASGYQTYPHVDHYETGYRTAEQLMHILRTGVRPYKIYHEIPMIMSCENSNTIDSPMAPIMHRTQVLLAQPGVVGGSVFLTQPWLDVPELNCSICIFAEDEEQRDSFDQEAAGILNEIWEKREQFYPPMPQIQEALERCRTMPKPICLVDYGDVPNAGGSGDGTAVLQALLEANLDISSAVVIADRESTEQAVHIGAGGHGTFSIGGFGKCGEFNQRISVDAEVLRLNPEPFVHLGPAMKGFISRPGMRALLRVGNIYIILCENVCISHDQAMLRTMGLDPAELGIISMRATHSFMSCYADVMGSWLYVDTPGYSTRNLKTLPFRKCRRPIYPLDESCGDQ
ncbi:Microcystin degradation protein MlrC, contains DUF1485 domain [Oscillibacter sp. PC13]|uniref:M81 family metallopeptidase n=1 Tax=Oscillibacter sp. PC13 TaxID=1855299 RepID=UPI0008EA8FBD|nr:M81 family metallopeptidase [Oscillibacter sp. PC13]SFP61928.1 Microcystin degradation protein MlrC, contains DUF1485 domain [Oscillibacter sp. PC13]